MLDTMCSGKLLRPRQRRTDVLGLDHLNCFAAEALNDARVIDALSLGDVGATLAVARIYVRRARSADRLNSPLL
jgi:hypothetical protein